MTNRVRLVIVILSWEVLIFLLSVCASEFGLAWHIHMLDWRLFGAQDNPYSVRNMVIPRAVAWLMFSIPASFLGLSLYKKLGTGKYETRCRRCSYILRGLREPRCSECGEDI